MRDFWLKVSQRASGDPQRRAAGAARGDHGLPKPTALCDAPTAAGAFAPCESERGTLRWAHGERRVRSNGPHGVRHMAFSR